jgi:DNA polymerase
MPNLWSDLETYSTVPINAGTHRYSEEAEVMIWAFADGDGNVYVWDLVNSMLHWQDEISGLWFEEAIVGIPAELERMLADEDYLVWFQNGGMFDFVILQNCTTLQVNQKRWRDTMVQAFAHSLPGSLEKLGIVLDIEEDKRKLKRGKQLVRLFCLPQSEAFVEKFGVDRATKVTHPAEWQEFVEYAAGDIITMREAHRKMPMWNYRDKQVDLWHLNLRNNYRGFAVDMDLARGAVAAFDQAQGELDDEVNIMTAGSVQAATQRDQLLKFILEQYGVELPDMKADTLERRLDDPQLPPEVKELLRVRLQASMNSASKFKALLKSVSHDGRLRGCEQFRGAGRTGRIAHRLFQPGNLPRTIMEAIAKWWNLTVPELKDHHVEHYIELGIEAIKGGYADILFGNVKALLANVIRGVIVAPVGRKLVIADLANIEGRVAAWLVGEEWKIQAFRDYDEVMLDLEGNAMLDRKGKIKRKGPDLYILAYMKSFNHLDENSVSKDMRQIGKVQELMFQYQGGVGAWLTGAATYGIDLDAMTEQVWDTLPEWAKDEATNFLHWLYEKVEDKVARKMEKLAKRVGLLEPEAYELEVLAIQSWGATELTKARFALDEKVFITCDAIKRLWRNAHPKMVAYWSELGDAVKGAIEHTGVTYRPGKLIVRRDGMWLRIRLPSGRYLCYPNPKVEKDGSITYVGLNQYSRKWERISSYPGKFFENVVQAVANDQLTECQPIIEEQGYDIVLDVHDEDVTETPDDPKFNAKHLAELMCADLGWNEGLPLSAAGFETPRYRKE